MIVTRIESVAGKKTKFRICFDGQPTLVLYKGELSRYHIEADKQMDEETYRTLSELVRKRARIRAMKLLEIADRSEKALMEKLLDGGYSREAAEDAVSYVKSFGYLDDDRLAGYLVASRKATKSKAELKAYLLGKGLSRNQAEEALARNYKSEDAQEAIRRHMTKKHFDPETATPQEKQRIYAFLARKGFAYEDIRQVIQVSDWNA